MAKLKKIVLPGIRQGYLAGVDGNVYFRKKGQLRALKQVKSNLRDKERGVFLFAEDGRYKKFYYLHTLILTIFRGHRCRKEFAPWFLNRDKLDYRLVNLRWRRKNVGLFDILTDSEWTLWMEKMETMKVINKIRQYHDAVVNQYFAHYCKINSSPQARKEFFDSKFKPTRTVKHIDKET